MAEAFLVGDGYELDGRVPRAEGIHPELTFTYRPALHDERNRHLQKSANPDRRTAAAAELVVKHVLNWNVTDRAGVARDKPTAETAERLRPLLLDKLVDVVLGYAPAGTEEGDRKNS